ERFNTASRVRVTARVGVKCIKTASHVVDAGRVGVEGKRTAGHVVTAVRVGVEGIRTAGRVAVAIHIGKQRVVAKTGIVNPGSGVGSGTCPIKCVGRVYRTNWPLSH